MDQWLRLDQQPTLQEMLDDPVVAALMDRDGVTRREVEALMADLRDTIPSAVPANRQESDSARSEIRIS